MYYLGLGNFLITLYYGVFSKSRKIRLVPHIPLSVEFLGEFNRFLYCSTIT